MVRPLLLSQPLRWTNSCDLDFAAAVQSCLALLRAWLPKRWPRRSVEANLSQMPVQLHRELLDAAAEDFEATGGLLALLDWAEGHSILSGVCASALLLAQARLT